MTCKSLLTPLAVFLALTSAGEAIGQAPPPDAYGVRVPDGDYYIVGNHNGSWSYMCLDVPDWDTRPNVLVQLFPLQNQLNQRWRVRRQADGFYRITNVFSGMALDVPNGSRNPGVYLQQYTPNSGDNQRWRFDLTFPVTGPDLFRPGFYRIVNKHSGLTLDVPYGNYSPHTLVQQYTPLDGWNQTWLVDPSPTVQTVLRSAAPTAALDVRLDTWEGDGLVGRRRTFWKTPGRGRPYSGDYRDLGNAGWNDVVRSVVFQGPAGTTVWLYDKKGFGQDDDVIEIRIPADGSPVVLDNIDRNHPASVRYVRRYNGAAGKVSGIQWR